MRNYSFQPTASEELKSVANSHVSEPSWKPTLMPQPNHHVMQPWLAAGLQSHKRPWSRPSCEAMLRFLTPRNCETIHFCSFKLLHLGKICYTVVPNCYKTRGEAEKGQL